MSREPISEYYRMIRDHDGRLKAIVTTNDGAVVVSTAAPSGCVVMHPDVAGMFARSIVEAGVWADKICRKGWRDDMAKCLKLENENRVGRSGIVYRVRRGSLFLRTNDDRRKFWWGDGGKIAEFDTIERARVGGRRGGHGGIIVKVKAPK